MLKTEFNKVTKINQEKKKITRRERNKDLFINFVSTKECNI